MNNIQAICAIENNWPDEKYTILREALTLAIEALSEEWRVPDETTPGDAAVWLESKKDGKVSWKLMRFYATSMKNQKTRCYLVKENQGPPPDDWRSK
jgi:hypothetical protein